MPGKSHKISNGAHLDDDLLYRHLEKMTTLEEEELIEQHLDTCNSCFADLIALTEVIQTPITEAEKIEIARTRKVSAEEQVQRILGWVEAGRPVENQIDDVSTTKTYWDKFINRLADIRQHFGNFWKPAVAWPAIVLLLILGGRPQYLAWRSQVFADRGFFTLVVHAPIASREEPRPTGGFKYDEFGGLTRSGEPQLVYDSVRTNLEKALQFKNNNIVAQHYWGTYYLTIEKNWGRAKAEYLIALAADSTNASILNDLGVVAFYQGDDDEALKKFSLALKYDFQLVEAHYNLATLYQKQGKLEDARREWEKCLEYESNSGWTKVIRNQLEQLY